MNEKAVVFAIIMTGLTMMLAFAVLRYGLWDVVVWLASAVGLFLAVGFVGVLFYLIGKMLFGKQ